jgi:hypothetical protein
VTNQAHTQGSSAPFRSSPLDGVITDRRTASDVGASSGTSTRRAGAAGGTASSGPHTRGSGGGAQPGANGSASFVFPSTGKSETFHFSSIKSEPTSASASIPPASGHSSADKKVHSNSIDYAFLASPSFINSPLAGLDSPLAATHSNKRDRAGSTDDYSMAMDAYIHGSFS